MPTSQSLPSVPTRRLISVSSTSSLTALPAQRRVADGNEGVVEIAIEIFGAGKAVLEADDVDPFISLAEVRRKGVLARHRD